MTIQLRYAKCGLGVCLSLALVCLESSLRIHAQDTTAPGTADPKITAAMMQVSATRIQARVEKLVSFQTRSTLSAQDSASIAAGHGIGAAREWIKSEFTEVCRWSQCESADAQPAKMIDARSASTSPNVRR